MSWKKNSFINLFHSFLWDLIISRWHGWGGYLKKSCWGSATVGMFAVSGPEVCDKLTKYQKCTCERLSLRGFECETWNWELSLQRQRSLTPAHRFGSRLGSSLPGIPREKLLQQHLLYICWGKPLAFSAGWRYGGRVAILVFSAFLLLGTPLKCLTSEAHQDGW